MKNIEVTVLIPTKNEALTISKFVEWVFQGFENSNVRGELILLDSSTDETAVIAEQLGAKVISVSESGLGNAYRLGVSHVNGKWVLLGDADCTYDFRNIQAFLTNLQNGSDFVMGNRFRGTIEKGAMPLHHRYFGTPLTTWILTGILKLPFGDIHCGMRAITKKLLQELPFDEPGWEYAPEMIIQACKLTDNFSEVPIDFHKEPEGRISHFRRGKLSFLSPYKAGIGALRVTFAHGLDRAILGFGIFLLIFSTILVAALSLKSFHLFGFRFSTITQLLFVNSGIVGHFMYTFGSFMRREYAGKIPLTGLKQRTQNQFIIWFATFTVMTTSLSLLFLSSLFKKSSFVDNVQMFKGVIILGSYFLTLSTISLVIRLAENYFTMPSRKK